MTIDELVTRHDRIALDRDVLICLFEDASEAGAAAWAVLNAVGDGRCEGVLATVALTEILTRPAAIGDGALFEWSVDAIRSYPNLRLIPLVVETAIDAARGRSTDRDLGDAVHLAAARASGATAFVTNDRRVRPRTGVEIVPLRDLVA